MHTDPNWPTYFFILLMTTIIAWAWTHRAPPKWWWVVAALAFSVATWGCATNRWFKVGSESELKVVNHSRVVIMAIVVAPDMNNRQYVFGEIPPGDSLTHILHMADTKIVVNINGVTYQLQHTDQPMNYRIAVGDKP